MDVNKYNERFLEGICEDECSSLENNETLSKVATAASSSTSSRQAKTILQPGEKGFKDEFYKTAGRYLNSDLSMLKHSITAKYFEGIVWHFASYYRYVHTHTQSLHCNHLPPCLSAGNTLRGAGSTHITSRRSQRTCTG